MPIRYVDRRAHIGQMPVSLDDVQALLQGTHVLPAGRTGIIATQLGAVTSSIIGGFTQSANRTGNIIALLGDVSPSITGTFVAPGGMSAPGVAGAIADDATVIINALPGESFGSTGPVIYVYDNYGGHAIGSNVDATATIGEWSEVNNVGISGKIDAVPGLYKGRGVQVVGVGSNTNCQQVIQWPANQEVFATWKVFVPADRVWPGASGIGVWPGISSLKSAWLMYLNRGDGEPDEYDQYLYAHSGLTDGRILASGSNDTTAGTIKNWGFTQFRFGFENRVSVWIKGNGSSAGTQRYEVMNEDIHHIVNKNEAIFGAGVQQLFDRIKVCGWIAGAQNYNNNQRMYFQEQYVASNPARVELCNHVTYSLATKAYIWTTESWTNNSIACKIRNALPGWAIHAHNASGNHTNGGTGRLLAVS